MMQDFSKFKKIIKFEGYLENLTALHIGKGRAIDAAAASDMPVIKDILGRPFIPGSSLKGAIRSFTEALVRSLNKKNLIACNLIDGDFSGCLNPQDPSTEEMTPEEKLQNLCTVCSIFGHPLVASKVRFLDLPVEENTWHDLMLQVRDGVVIDRESGVAREGGKYDFEVVPPGVRFKLEVFIDNPEDWELGLLFLVIDRFNDGLWFLGGNVSRGLGRTKIVIEKCLEFTPENLLRDEKLRIVELEKFKKECIDKFKERLEKSGGKNAKT